MECCHVLSAFCVRVWFMSATWRFIRLKRRWDSFKFTVQTFYFFRQSSIIIIIIIIIINTLINKDILVWCIYKAQCTLQWFQKRNLWTLWSRFFTCALNERLTAFVVWLLINKQLKWHLSDQQMTQKALSSLSGELLLAQHSLSLPNPQW